ncbi:ArnT family glycosyltransferase [Stratiformator vulcanicus]|uniref:Glycosyltransferase RgtA/B/C/D-like domain-containing protein n=1 Tax=Stratiformator vulcanicus TaxID=2527980 RepID=A0A517R3R1_9PLAN|nr:glycosyltransferase family 39 protein [Stratiformator vulcanicus]QDT38539.1 hypothetical protein Pan189_29330 [Stratiformator vulcanicus]
MTKSDQIAASEDRSSLVRLIPIAIGAWLVLAGILFATVTLTNAGSDWTRLKIAFVLLDGIARELPSGVQFLPQRIDLLLTAISIVAGAFAMGRLLVRSVIPRDFATALERQLFAIAIGYSAVSLLTLAAGLVGALSRPLFMVVLVAAVLAECALTVVDRRCNSGTKLRWPKLGRVEIICIATATPFVILALLGAMFPPMEFDVKEYHLGGPKEFFVGGAVTFLPHNAYTSFPFFSEMLSLCAMVLRDDWYRGALAGKLVLATFGPLTGLAIYAAGKRLFSPATGAVAGLFYVSAPWTYRLSVIAYVEGALSFYVAMAILSGVVAVIAIREGTAGAWRVSLLLGLISGTAVACKYPGLVQVVIPAGALMIAAVLFARRRFARRRSHQPAEDTESTERPSGRPMRLLTGSVFALGVLLTCGPWLLKNTIETGNPVYPLLFSVLGGADWDPELDAKWGDAHSPPHFRPVTLATEAFGIAAKNDWQTAVVLLFAPLSLLRVREPRTAILCGLSLYLYLAWWLLTHRIDRFWVPMLPALVLLSAVGFETARRSIGNAMPVGMAGIAIAFNLGLIFTGICGPAEVLADLDAARKYSERSSTGIAAVNKLVEPGDRVLLVGEAEIFDARFRPIYNTVFDKNIVEEWMGDRSGYQPFGGMDSLPPETIAKTLEDQEIKYILVNWSEIARYRTTYGYSDFVTPAIFDDLVAAGVLGEPIAAAFVELDALPSNQRKLIEREFPQLIKEGRPTVFLAETIYRIRSRAKK